MRIVNQITNKIDLVDQNRFSTLTDLIIEIGEQTYYYNNTRIHSKLKTNPNLFSEDCPGAPAAYKSFIFIPYDKN